MTTRPRLTPLLALMAIRATGAFQLQSAAVAAPWLIAERGLSYAEIGMLIGAYMVPGIFLTVPGGLLAGRIGDRPVMRGAMLVMALGAVASALADSFPAMLAGRVLSGCGGVVMLMLVIKMTTDRYAGPMLSTATSMVIVSWPAGFALALVVLGPVGEMNYQGIGGWRWVLGLSGLPVFCAIALTFLVGHAAPLAPRLAGVVERVVTWRFIAAASGNWTLYNAAIAVMAGFLPAMLADAGRPAVVAAALASVVTWSFAAATPFGGLLADRLIGRPVAVYVGAVATGVMLLAVAPADGAVAVLVLLGIAYAIPPGALTAQVGEGTPPAARALVFGWYSAGSYVGLTIAPWIAGTLRDVTADPNAPMIFGAVLMFAMLPCFAWFRFELKR